MKERKDYERRLVAARLPRKHDLDEYDYNFYEGIDRRQMKELRELVWLREAYNLILMGPSGPERHFWQPVLSLMRSRPVTRHT